METERDMPPKLQWPKEPLVSTAPLACAIGVFGVIASILLAGISQIPISTRLVLVILVLLIATLSCACVVLGRRAVILWRRALCFDTDQAMLDETISSLAHELEARGKLDAIISFLSQALDASGAGLFLVEGAIQQHGRPVLVLRQTSIEFNGKALTLGDRVCVANQHSWAVLGIFEVAGLDGRGNCYAQEVAVSNAVWWGRIHAGLTPHAVTNLSAVALLVASR